MISKLYTNHLKIVIVLFSFLGLQSCKIDSPTELNFNSGWKFKIIEEVKNVESNIYDVTYDDSDWDKVELPHTAHIEPLIILAL